VKYSRFSNTLFAVITVHMLNSSCTCERECSNEEIQVVESARKADLMAVRNYFKSGGEDRLSCRIGYHSHADIHLAAIESENLDMVELVYGKKLNEAMGAALGKGKLALGKSLYSQGAKIRVQDHDPLLHGYAFSREAYPFTLKQLIDANANLNTFHKTTGQTPLVGVLYFLAFDRYELHFSSNNWTPSTENITGAVFLKKGGEMWVPSTVDILLKVGVDLEGVDRFGRTALIVASQLGLEDIVNKLIQNGAQVNAIDHNEMSAYLHAARGVGKAAKYNKIELSLQRAGAKISHVDKNGYGRQKHREFRINALSSLRINLDSKDK
jgi:hypothetical protein